MKRLSKILLLLLVASMLLVGCSRKKIKVGYTVYPVQYLLEEIGKDKVETVAFSTNRMITRSQVVDNYKEVLKEVDNLFIMGEVEPYLDIINQDILDANTDIVDLSLKSGVLNFSRLTKVDVESQQVDIVNRYYENPIFDSVDKYNVDPYLWLDPITMTSMANQVRNYLVSVDPDHTEFYNENFNQLKIELAYLDANFLELRSGYKFAFATMTPSFGIWQNNYNYSISPIILSKYGVLPTEQQLELIKVRLISDGVKYLIVEENLDDDVLALADQLVSELDLEKITLSNLAFRSQAEIDSDLDYLQIMNKNLSILENLGEEILSQREGNDSEDSSDK